MDTTAAPANLLDPSTLAQSLKATFLSSLGNDSASEDAAADEAIRVAIETCEKATALLKAELVGSDSEDNELPPAKRRAVERNQAASDVSGLASSSSATNPAGPGTYTGTPATLLSTKAIHTQQPDGSWSTAVVPCEPRAVDAHVRGTAPLTEGSNILASLQDELRQEVLSYSCYEQVQDLGRVRMASKAVHEAMMGTELNLFRLRPLPSVAQLTALGRGTTLHKFKQVPEEQRCSCVAGRALDRTSFGPHATRGGGQPASARAQAGAPGVPGLQERAARAVSV